MATTFHNQGSVLGYGDAGNNHTLFSNFKNPAFLGGDDTSRQWGLGLSIGIDAEYKDVTGVGDNFTTLQNSLDGINTKLQSPTGYLQDVINDGFNPITDEAGTVLEIQTRATNDTVDAINTFFTANENLQITTKASSSIPLVIQTTGYGGFMLAASVTTGGTTYLIRNGEADADVIINDPLNPATATFQAQTNAGMAFNAFQMTEISASYSMDLNRYIKPTSGQINLGLRAKMMNAAFNQYVVDFDDAVNSGDEFGDQVSDGLSEATNFDETSSTFGLDIGVQYIAKNYLVGLTVENINSPSFDYTLINNTAFDALLVKDITFEPKARIEAATYSQNRRWTFAGFADLTKTMDITGLETQKAGVAASYASDKWLLPDIRFGYTNESAGNKMSRIHGGITVGFLSLDVAANSFEFGEDVENSLAANLSMELAF
jgi:hypothetical protein